jgi:hypothetical protein
VQTRNVLVVQTTIRSSIINYDHSQFLNLPKSKSNQPVTSQKTLTIQSSKPADDELTSKTMGRITWVFIEKSTTATVDPTAGSSRADLSHRELNEAENIGKQKGMMRRWCCRVRCTEGRSLTVLPVAAGCRRRGSDQVCDEPATRPGFRRCAALHMNRWGGWASIGRSYGVLEALISVNERPVLLDLKCPLVWPVYAAFSQFFLDQ